ncbi:MAG: hypothetical protein PWP08_1824 [Methanofollis sp.]|nr:hypothetical protein [Methanofollis sp.]
MATVVFSDVHADARALSRVAAHLKNRRFAEYFGNIDCIVSLGDLLGRGYAPVETLAAMDRLKKEYQVISLLGNHDHAFVHGISVSGSDAASIRAHAPLEGSPLLDEIAGLPVETVIGRTLFVHGGPLSLGDALTDQPFWQRLSQRPGPSLSGYHYTPEMAFAELERRHVRHLCCGHQHVPLCCLLNGKKVANRQIRYESAGGLPDCDTVILDRPAILRVGACSGPHPEFAVTDFERFSFLRL